MFLVFSGPRSHLEDVHRVGNVVGCCWIVEALHRPQALSEAGGAALSAGDQQLARAVLCPPQPHSAEDARGFGQQLG